MLKVAMTSSNNSRAPFYAAKLTNRWANGDYSLAIGELSAMCKLVALWKDKTRTDVRPVGIGGALRRLLTKTYCSQIKSQFRLLVGDHQLGVLKAGYEKGIHSLRALIPRCKFHGWVVFILDFRNAFNTIDRNLMIKLAAAHSPEIARLARWLYHNESDLITQGDNVVKSSSGVQQGCPLANPLFALVMKYIMDRLRSANLDVKMSFWDDGVLVGSPEATAMAARIIQDLEKETGLSIKWKKCHTHAPSDAIARS